MSELKPASKESHPSPKEIAPALGKCAIDSRLHPRNEGCGNWKQSDGAAIIEIERETDGRWIAEIPSVPGAMAYGESPIWAILKALVIAQDAAESCHQPKEIK